MVPLNVAAAIGEHGITPHQGRVADGPCEGAAHHSPTPLTLQTVLLDPGQVDGPAANLCPTCAANLKVLQALLRETAGDLDWHTRREFGNRVRALALRGWQHRQDREVSNG